LVSTFVFQIQVSLGGGSSSFDRLEWLGFILMFQVAFGSAAFSDNTRVNCDNHLVDVTFAIRRILILSGSRFALEFQLTPVCSP